MSPADSRDWPSIEAGAVRGQLRSAMVTGLAIVVPVLVTLFVLGFVLNFISGALNPAVKIAYSALGLSGVSEAVVKTVALVCLVLLIPGIGLPAQRDPENNSFENSFDEMMARIPGVGGLYTSFNEMSELLLSSDSNSFREVTLVEFPTTDSYAVGFITADTSEPIERAAGHDEMKTVFVPMAPNPVMGGFVLHVAPDRLTDVDMTVQEGISSIVTSGVSIDGIDSPEQLEDLASSPVAERVVDESTWPNGQVEDAGDRSGE